MGKHKFAKRKCHNKDESALSFSTPLYTWLLEYAIVVVFCNPLYHFNRETNKETLPKAQRTRGLRSAYQSNLLRSYHKFKRNTWSNFIFRISTKQQLQNLDQISASGPKLKFKILTKPSFIISTKIQLHNHCMASAAKYCPNSSFKSRLYFNFKILTKPCTRSLNKSLALWPNISFHICNKLLPTRSPLSTTATVTTSTSFELASSRARVTSIKWTKR